MSEPDIDLKIHIDFDGTMHINATGKPELVESLLAELGPLLPPEEDAAIVVTKIINREEDNG